MEGCYNATLTGVDGRQYGYINNNSDVEETIIEPTDGKSIETSLDLGLQQIVEKYVNTFEEKMGAKNVGVITFIDKQVNTNTSVVAARAEFVNPDLFVLPGQFVRVTLSGMELVNAILIPQQAVIQTQKGSMVVVIGEGDKAEMRPVDLGDNYGDSFLLNKGVKAGERIVVEGGNKAVPGQPVRIQQASVQDAKLPDQPVGTGSDSGKAE